MIFSPQQDIAIKEVDRWFKSKNPSKPFYYLAGFAGTGKTSLAKYFAQHINGDVLYCAYTGKAALVMRKNGCQGASTIHSLLYIPVVNPKTGAVTFKYNRNSPIEKAKLIIVDECSMVDNRLGEDLVSFGVPILVLGDPAQLPPVKGAGYFTNGEPDSMLTEIHRQAKDNPIIYLASRVREKDRLRVGQYGDSKVTDKYKRNEIMMADKVICGTNKSRITINDSFRKNMGFEGLIPQKGESLICLKNNNDLGIFNGEMMKVQSAIQMTAPTDYIKLVTESEDNEGKIINSKVLQYHFDTAFKEPTDWRIKSKYEEMTYGYCLTGHKSQGSQFDRVYVVDESHVFGDVWWRWLYTSITRAAEIVEVYV